MAKHSSKSKDLTFHLDCTSQCSLKKHADIVLSCVALGNLKLLQHCKSICGNPFQIVDHVGRNVLLVAASKGHLHIVAWLLAKKRVSINLADFESRWSALHRSIFYGHLGVALHLSKSGANLYVKDFGGCTPLALLSEDKRHFMSEPTVSEIGMYTWGNNTNLTLGHDHSKKHPEKLDLRNNYTVSQVVLCKFHTVFLTEGGAVLTSGHGRGGRLGHGNEQSVVTPLRVKALAQFKCIAVAAARDHTVMLTKSGVVYTCGLNDAHQLGLGTNPSSAPTNCLTPKPVKSLKHKCVTSIGVGRYHTAMCTSTEVYTMGKNLGQLGFDKHHETTSCAPRVVPGINLEADDSILHLSVSDAATACITKRHRIFVCTAYTVKPIRCAFFEKNSCIQFTVCASLSDLDYLRKVETEPTKVLMLDSNHQVWYWEPTKKGGPLPVLDHYKVTQLCLGKCLTIVTGHGEVYSGPAVAGAPLKLTRIPGIQNAKSVFTDFKANNFAYLQKVYRAPVLPETSPSTFSGDLTGLLEESCLPGGTTDLEIEVCDQLFSAHKFILASASPVFAALFQTEGCNSTLPKCVESYTNSRLVLKTDNPTTFEVFLHYMYGSHISVKHGPLDSTLPSESTLDPDSTPDTSFASVDDNDLTALYDQYAAEGSHSELFDEYQVPIILNHSTPKKRSGNRHRPQKDSASLGDNEPRKDFTPSNLRNDLKALLMLASDFHISSLKSVLERLLGLQSLKHVLQKQPTLKCPKLSLRNRSQLSDLLLVSTEGEEISCHKCVLVARSDYFRSMLLMGWRESSDSTKSLKLPVDNAVLKAVVDYIYTDEAPDGLATSTVNWIVNVLVVADQLLLTRLKDMCEQALAKQLTLRNVGDLVKFAVTFSANQLKQSCLQFICVNAASLLEGRYLESLDSTLLNELSAVYQEMAPAITKRTIKFSDPDESQLPESYFLDEEPMLSSSSDSELPNGKATWEENGRHSPAYLDSVSPRPPSSGSNRKRRRKSSQSDNKRITSPPPMSPECLSPKEDECLHVVSTPRNFESKQTQNSCDLPRTKLLSRFDSLPKNDLELVADGKVEKCQQLSTTTGVQNTKQESSSLPLPAKSAWSNPSNRFRTTTSLKEIMAMEERARQLERQKHDTRSPPPSHLQSDVMVASHPVSSPRAVPVYQRQSSQPSPVSSPSAITQSPPAINPWKVNKSPVPALSLRDLMAEAEAEQKQENDRKSSSQTILEKCHQVKRKPFVIPHHTISFATIVRNQQAEQEDRNKASGKHFSSIQIEEQAIEELRNLYCTHNNSDEYITVERCLPTTRKTSLSGAIVQSSPWCQDVM